MCRLKTGMDNCLCIDEVCSGDGCHLCEEAPSLKITSLLQPGHGQAVWVMDFVPVYAAFHHVQARGLLYICCFLLLALFVSVYQLLFDSTCSFTCCYSASLNVGRVHSFGISVESDLQTRATCTRDLTCRVASTVASCQPEIVCFGRRLDRYDEVISLR